MFLNAKRTMNIAQIRKKICGVDIVSVCFQMRSRKPVIVIFLIIAVILYVLSKTRNSDGNSPAWLLQNVARGATVLELHSSFLKSAAPSSKCLTATLYAIHNGGRTGNVVFELIGLYAISKKVGRVAVVYDEVLNSAIKDLSESFPNVVQFFREATYCGPPTFIDIKYRGCCNYDRNIINTILLHEKLHSITVKLFYLQSYKFFSNLSPHIIRLFFTAAPHLQKAASFELFRTKPLEDALNICIHIRRGDFQKSADSVASEEEFTRTAANYVISKALEKNSRLPYIYVMSDDISWAQDTFRNYTRTRVAYNNSAPGTEWEFSRRYCDIVLMTASMSTYGYWIAYLSRGQKVYYNYVFTPEFERQLKPDDFWPQHWSAIQYDHKRNVITEHVF